MGRRWFGSTQERYDYRICFGGACVYVRSLFKLKTMRNQFQIQFSFSCRRNTRNAQRVFQWRPFPLLVVISFSFIYFFIPFNSTLCFRKKCRGVDDIRWWCRVLPLWNEKQTYRIDKKGAAYDEVMKYSDEFICYVTVRCFCLHFSIFRSCFFWCCCCLFGSSVAVTRCAWSPDWNDDMCKWLQLCRYNC